SRAGIAEIAKSEPIKAGASTELPATETFRIVRAGPGGAQQASLLHQHADVAVLVQQREPGGLALALEHDRHRGLPHPEIVHLNRVDPPGKGGLISLE